MGASFAKAVMPRLRREDEIKRDSEWSPGWIFPENTERLPAAEFESPKISLRGTGDSKSAPLPTEEASH